MGIWIWEYHIKASENLAIPLASGYMGIYHGHLDMEVPYQGIRESCDSSGIRIYGDISRASGYGSTISRHQRILRFFWHPDIWGYIKGIWIWEYHIKASENLAILLASGYMGIYHGHLGMGVPYQGIRESCDSSGIRIYRDISWASGYGSTISRHQRILRFFWHPDIWGYIMGIWVWEYHINASENLAILLASGYIGIYHGHLDMEVPYQGIRESCDSSGIRIYGDISRASGYGSTISRHQRILRFFWHPDIWGYIKGIWIWEYHIKASENLAILLASGYMGIYHGHLGMGVPYQGIRESCDSSGIRIYGDISWASGYGSTISRHQRILRFFWHPDIWGYIMGIWGIWIWEYHIKASENLAILLASGYIGIYHGHLDMGVPYQGIRESCDSSGIRIYGDIPWASRYGSTISRHQRILRFFWHPDIWGYIKGIWIWEYHIKASENLAILLASGYMGIYHGHLGMGVPYQGIRESCDSSGIRRYRDISWASGYGSTISRHQRILRFFWHPDIWGYIMGIWVWEYHIKASENLAILLASGYMGIYHGHLGMGVPYQGIRESCDSSGIRIYGDISWASGDLQSQLSDQKRTHLEEKQTWDSTIGLLNEKVECSRIENEFTKQEMKRLGDQHQAKLVEKENELRKVISEMRARMRDEQSKQEDDGTTTQLSDMLLQKQQQLEDVLRTNQVLNVRLERLQKATNRETSIPIDNPNSSPMHTSSSHPLLSNINHPQTRNALQTVDSTAFKLLSMLRGHPSARLFFVLYFIMMHLWLFFIVLTYTPEIH
ncbi:hypothetical protein B9Z55_000206 [Caenorhabditis nigoni]|uniref:Uncharacterized protein n=1 Tax=Caenorhabditis nigoni TaxID=1611254 RepID=A0A2G5VIM2_9PELO|nr:hypothetical protein B9Z55_000206 [Caenorhabditis nigoni]